MSWINIWKSQIKERKNTIQYMRNNLQQTSVLQDRNLAEQKQGVETAE